MLRVNIINYHHFSLVLKHSAFMRRLIGRFSEICNSILQYCKLCKV